MGRRHGERNSYQNGGDILSALRPCLSGHKLAHNAVRVISNCLNRFVIVIDLSLPVSIRDSISPFNTLGGLVYAICSLYFVVIAFKVTPCFRKAARMHRDRQREPLSPQRVLHRVSQRVHVCVYLRTRLGRRQRIFTRETT